MYKGRGYEDTSPEMAREEDELVRYWELRVFTGDDRKGACCNVTLAIVYKSSCSKQFIPIVLRARMRTSAPTWIDVL